MNYSSTAFKKFCKEYEKKVIDRGYMFLGAWVAKEDSCGEGYQPDVEVGDIVVSLKGHDDGSVSWEEVVGNVRDF